MLYNNSIINFEYYEEQLASLHLDDPFNIDQIVEKSEEVINDKFLDEYAKQAVLKSTVQMSGIAGYISLNASAKVVRYFKHLLLSGYSIKESKMTMDEKLAYLNKYPIKTHYYLDGQRVQEVTQNTAQDVLSFSGKQLVSGEEMIQRTGQHFVNATTAILPYLFYVVNQHEDVTNVASYTFIGHQLLDVLVYLDDNDDLGASIDTDPDLSENGYDKLVRTLSYVPFVREFEGIGGSM